MTKKSPSSTVNDEFCTAVKPENSLRRFSTRISAMAHSGNFETTMNITVPISMVMNEYE